MRTMTIEEAKEKLVEIVQGLAPGEEVALTSDSRLVAKLIGQAANQPRPIFGRGRGKVVVVSENDDHLQGFEDYMP